MKRMSVFLRCLAAVAGIFMSRHGYGAAVLVNGQACGPDVCWSVTLKAGTAGSLFGDTLGPVRWFTYETVATVDGVEKLVIEGGTYSTDMYDSTYTVKIPLKKLGLLEPDAVGTHYLTAFTRNYENGTSYTGYSLITEDIYITISKPSPPYLGALTVTKGEEMDASTGVSKKQIGSAKWFLVAGSPAEFEVEVLNFNKEYYTLKQSKLVGKPVGNVASKEHVYFNGSLRCSSEGDVIVFMPTLDFGSGFHGEYSWHVEAEFVGIDGETEGSESQETEEPVFFEKYGKDHNTDPNWFRYWKEDGACPSLNTKSKEIIVWEGVFGYGFYGKKGDGTIEWSKKVYIHPFNAAEEHYVDGPYEVTRPQVHYFGGPHVWGIYTTEEVVSHELNHASRQDEYNGWLGLKGDVVSIWVDSDRFKPQKSLKISSTIVENGIAKVKCREIDYCDYLIDSKEHGEYELDHLKCDTYNIAAVKKTAEYAAYGDDEFLAMIAANKATDEWRAKWDKDWAFPGEQSWIPNEVEAARQTDGWYQKRESGAPHTKPQSKSATSTHAQITTAAEELASGASPSITVKSMAKEIDYDDKTSLVSAVRYKLDMKVEGLHELRLSGVLTDLSDNPVAYAHAVVPNGTVTAELTFNGSDIYESKMNGPFRLGSVNLVEFSGIDFAELATLSEFKDAEVDLRREDLARNDAYLQGVVGETVTSEGIKVSVDVEVNVAGEYEIAATLVNADGTPVASSKMAANCAEGMIVLPVVFSADEIVKAGIDGPYIVDNISLRKNGTPIDSRIDYYVLKKQYRSQAFDFAEGEKVDSAKFMAQFADYTPPVEVQKERYWVFFNPNGGKASETIREVAEGDGIGTLPTATLENNDFLGWFTEVEGGSRVSESTVVTTNVMYHAHWKESEGGAAPQPETPQEPDNDQTLLSGGDVFGAIASGSASIYYGCLYKDAKVEGTVQITIGKPNARTGMSAVKATVVGRDGKKKTLKAADKGKVKVLSDRPTTISLVGGESCTVKIGEQGVYGRYGNYVVDGTIDVFTSKDIWYKAFGIVLLPRWYGPVNAAWRTSGGWNCVSVTVGKKGKSKVSGTLADGTKLSGQAQFVVGYDSCAIPVVLARKVSLAFMMWLGYDGITAKVQGLGGEVVAGKAGALKAGAKFRIDAEAFSAKWGQSALPYLPDGVAVTQSGTRWTLPKAGKVQMAKDGTVDAAKLGDNPAALKLSYKAKDGSFKGSFKAYSLVNGKPKAVTVRVAGVVIDGVGYGSAAIGKAGQVAVEIR